MNGCSAMQAKFSEYLDGRLTGREMQRIAAHLERCPGCAGEWKALRQNQATLASLGPVPEPEDLLLRIRVAVSQERARRARASSRHGLSHGETRSGRFCCRPRPALPARCCCWARSSCWSGMFTQPEAAQATNDDPLGNATAPRLLGLSGWRGRAATRSAPLSGPVVVEAYVNSEGTVYDYRIVSGPTDAATRSQVENLLVL